MQPKNIQVYLQLAKLILESIYDVKIYFTFLSFLFFYFILKLRSLFETFPSSGEDAQPLLKQTSNQHEKRPPFIDLVTIISYFT